MKTSKLAIISILAAIICVLAPFSLPAGAIPLSLATFAIYLVSSVVDKKYALCAIFVYILIGAMGLPVFSSFSGGFQKLAGVTGGYIIGYLPCSLIIGLITEKLENKKWAYPLSMVLGTTVCYAFGTAWYAFQAGVTFISALSICVLPFIPGDLIKIAAASCVGITLRKRLKRFF